MRNETFQTPGALKLELSLPAGSVALEALDGDTTHVAVEGRTRTSSGSSYASEATGRC